MTDIEVVWDSAAVKAWCEESPQARAIMDRAAAVVVTAMKAAIPVSAVQAVYAYPVPGGSSKGPVHKGRPIARPSGPARSRSRGQGDLPLRPPGYLRSTVAAVRGPEGEILVGATASYAAFVNDGTVAHTITSHGPWPLRNRATGQVFGPVVHHPGTRGVHFTETAAHALAGLMIHA